MPRGIAHADPALNYIVSGRPRRAPILEQVLREVRLRTRDNQAAARRRDSGRIAFNLLVANLAERRIVRIWPWQSPGERTCFDWLTQG